MARVPQVLAAVLLACGVAAAAEPPSVGPTVGGGSDGSLPRPQTATRPVRAAGSARRLVAAGNAAYAKGEYRQALEAYEQASVELPESAVISFDKGTCHYQLGDYAEARGAFEHAALKTKDLALEARCELNLGNCAFREAERQADSDLQKAIDALRASIRHSQRAIELDPQTTDDAAHNIEVARLALKTLLDKLQKQQEQAEQQQKAQQEIVEKLKELIQKQGGALDANQALADQDAQGEKLQEEAGKLADGQQGIKDETRELSKKMAEAGPPPQQGQPPSPMAQAKQHVDRSATEQAVAEERLRGAKLDEAKTSQQAALEELGKALAALTQPQPQGAGQQKQGDEEPKPQPKDEQHAAPEPRDETAQAILDEEKENQQRRRRREQPMGAHSVKKDW